MANGIYVGINSGQELAELDENRDKMHQIKVWFKNTTIIEIVSVIYLTFASPFHIFAAVFGVIYLILLNKKNANICKAGALIHLISALFVIITSAVYCILSFTSDAPSVSLLPKGLSMLVPEDDVINSDGNKNMINMLMDSIQIITAINLIISVVMCLLPVWFNIKAAKFCIMHDELKDKYGYPYFHPDIAIRKTAEEFQNAKERKIQTNITELTGTAENFTKIFAPKKESENSQAMKALVEEAEKLKKQKQMQTERKDILPDKPKYSDTGLMPEINVLPEIEDYDNSRKPSSDGSYMDDVKSSS